MKQKNAKEFYWDNMSEEYSFCLQRRSWQNKGSRLRARNSGKTCSWSYYRRIL